MASDWVAPIFTLAGVAVGGAGSYATALLSTGRASKDKKAESDIKVRLETRAAVIAETGKFVHALDGLIRDLAEYGMRLLTQHGARDYQDECDEAIRRAREKDPSNALLISDLDRERKGADRDYDEADELRAEALVALVSSCDDVLATASSCEIVAPDAIAVIVRTLTDRADLLKRTVQNNFWRTQELTWDTLWEGPFTEGRAAIASGVRNWIHAPSS
ncbi:hypothetical protein ACTXG7_02310 [Mycolicibacterium sp. Dal123E01]|uniref:hypothetical protein n=1 Tax=Mycolicibacterium sp. Dal123E01 TaxID=3457578 RepID=UPI00403E8CA2